MFIADEKQLDRITRLIDDMLDVSRIRSGKFSMNFERFELTGFVQDLVEQNSTQFAAAGCPVRVEVCKSITGSWDRLRLEQVVMNLLTNAMRYGAGKVISVQVLTFSDKAQIVVCDQGQGIAKTDHERIFERFERVGSGNQICGLGLGLYIVRQILEAHNASIRVESVLGQGATFVVELPITE